jgi:hypothetical protein
MHQLLRAKEGVGRAAWQLVLVVLALGWLCPLVAQATHIRAGDIQSRVDEVTGNPNHILFRLTIYRDKGGPGNQTAQQNLVDTYIFFGDNTSLHGTDTDASGKPRMTRTSDPVNSTADTEVLYFDFEHTYGGAGTYRVSFVGENRNAAVVNMDNSVNTSFYINSSVTINPAYGINHSPVLRAPAVDKAGVKQVFLHNPAAVDCYG